MKILNFSIHVLNNLLHNWNIIANIGNCFISILRTFQLKFLNFNTMDLSQDQEVALRRDGEVEEQEEAEQQALQQGAPQAAGEAIDYDEATDNEETDMDDDDEGDDEDEESDIDVNLGEEEDDGDDDDDSYDYEWNSSNSSIEDLRLEPGVTHRIRNALRYAIYRNRHSLRPKPVYTFQPLRLVKRNYKFRNSLSDYPLPRSGHRVIASESNLYSLGGYNPRSALSAARQGQCLLFQELWCYNFAANRWKLLFNAETARNMPSELASNALVIHNNVLISHGGTGYPFGDSCSNDCYVYTTNNNPIVKRLKVTGDLPTPQYGPGIVIHGDYLYTIGGTTGYDYSCDVYRLNLKTMVWENMYICRPEMRDDPEGRYRHEVVYDGYHIYVLGGGTSHSVYDLQRIPAFNLITNKWNYFDTLPDRTEPATQNYGFPLPRKCLSCVQHTASNGHIEAFITGGLQGDFTTYFNDIWKLNLCTKQWTKIRTAILPKPLYFHSAAHTGNGCMYIFGGIEYNEKEMRRRNDLYKMWMTIPKLSEICWEAITYYNEDLNRYGRDTLLKSGLPERFVQRLPSLRMRKHTHDAQSHLSVATMSKRLRSQSE